MFNTDVSIPMAFIAGFLSFFSPCILPLIPAYIMYMTGTVIEDELKKRKWLILNRTLGFVLGFTIIFIIMGMSASAVGRIFVKHKDVFTKLSGTLIIFFGLNMLGVFKLNFLQSEKRMKSPKKMNNWFSSVLMGIAFAAGWTPCFGPILASILIYAGSEATVTKGLFLLLTYSIGMAIPFILTALFINVFNKFLNKSEKIIKYISRISGVILIVFGLIILFNKIGYISSIFI